jgi:hypothetical protein
MLKTFINNYLIFYKKIEEKINNNPYIKCVSISDCVPRKTIIQCNYSSISVLSFILF